jgi:hypothetical protein
VTGLHPDRAQRPGRRYRLDGCLPARRSRGCLRTPTSAPSRLGSA